MEPLEQTLALILGNTIDVSWERSNCIERLPARDRVCSNQRVHSLQCRTKVLRRAALFLIERYCSACLEVVEALTNVRNVKRLKKALVWLADAVEDLVPRGPESIAASSGQFGEAQRGVVGRHWFEGDVTVPDGGI